MTRADIIAQIRASQGLAGIHPTEWTHDQRTDYNKALAAAFALHPEILSDAGAALVQKIITTPAQSLEDYTGFEQVRDFFAEMVEQAEEINPLSQRNRGSLAAVLVAAVLVYAAVSAWNHSRPAPSA